MLAPAAETSQSMTAPTTVKSKLSEAPASSFKNLTSPTISKLPAAGT